MSVAETIAEATAALRSASTTTHPELRLVVAILDEQARADPSDTFSRADFDELWRAVRGGRGARHMTHLGRYLAGHHDPSAPSLHAMIVGMADLPGEPVAMALSELRPLLEPLLTR